LCNRTEKWRYAVDLATFLDEAEQLFREQD